MRAAATSSRLSGVRSETSSTGWSAGPTCQTAMNVSKSSGVTPRRGLLSNVVPELGEERGGRRHRGDALRSDRDVDRRRRRHGDAKTRRADRASRLGERLVGRRRPPRIAGLVPGEDVQQVRGVLDGARERAGRREALEGAVNGALETRPREGLSPKSPQHDAGMRIEPPPSVACAAGTSPAASAAAAPPLEPPGVRSVFHGFRVAPLSSDSVNATVPNSGVFVLPTMTKPASRIRRTTARVEVRDVVGVGARGVGRADPGGRGEVLDADRDAAKRSLGRRRVASMPGGLERLVGDDGDEGVEGRIEPLDALERRARRARPRRSRRLRTSRACSTAERNASSIAAKLPAGSAAPRYPRRDEPARSGLAITWRSACAYDARWACPLAPPENRLSFAVRAGEQKPSL